MCIRDRDKDCVKGKAFWRAFPVLAYAIPGFITLLAFKFMFSYGGPVNQLIAACGKSAIGFLDLDAKWSARLIGLFVNCWISVPSIMLLATGIFLTGMFLYMKLQRSTGQADGNSSKN